MELGLLLRKRPKFGGIEMQLLYSTQVVTVSKLVVEWTETKRVCICVLQLHEEEQVVVGLRCFLVNEYLLPKMERVRWFLGEDNLLPDELWRT